MRPRRYASATLYSTAKASSMSPSRPAPAAAPPAAAAPAAAAMLPVTRVEAVRAKKFFVHVSNSSVLFRSWKGTGPRARCS